MVQNEKNAKIFKVIFYNKDARDRQRRNLPVTANHNGGDTDGILLQMTRHKQGI